MSKAESGTPFDGNMIVKNVLHRYQISQTDLCQKLDYSREAFSKVVNGHRALSVVKAKEIALAYDLDWRSFYETPTDRYVPATACVESTAVRTFDYTWMVKCPKEWHYNSKFYVICDPNREFDEYVYVITKKSVPFKVEDQRNAWTLFTTKDGSQFIGYIDGYQDSEGKMIRLYNSETKGFKIMAAKKMVSMQKGRALLPPEK